MSNKPSGKFRVFLMIDLSSSYGRNLLQGISQYVQKFGNWECEATFTFFGRNSYMKSLDKDKIDGIICFTPGKKELTKVLESGIPAIVKGVDKPVSGFINFCTDNMMLCKKAFDHFRHVGFERFAYCGIHNLHWSKERCEALQHIVTVHGYELIVYPRLKNKTLYKRENEKSILEKWLKSLLKPMALLAANDFRGKKSGSGLIRFIVVIGFLCAYS